MKVNEIIVEHIGKVKGGYRLYSHKGKNLGTFPNKAGAEKHEHEVQYLHAGESVEEAKATSQRLDPKCWKGKKIGNPKTKVKGGVRVNNCVPIEETYEGDEFYEAYGDIEETLEEAKYHGRTVPLNSPMRGDVKKFKVYVKDPKTGNIKKVNFGDPNMRIKKYIPARRKSFRARHHCDTNPGPKTKARYWSCRKW
jgi:hypothetical protein